MFGIWYVRLRVYETCPHLIVCEHLVQISLFIIEHLRTGRAFLVHPNQPLVNKHGYIYTSE